MLLVCTEETLQQYLAELIRRRVISDSALFDKMFLNYLYSQKIDADYFRPQKTPNEAEGTERNSTC